MNNIKERIKIFSGAQLKYIAFLSMLIDHTNKALIYPNLDGGALNRLSDFFDIYEESHFQYSSSFSWKAISTQKINGSI